MIEITLYAERQRSKLPKPLIRHKIVRSERTLTFVYINTRTGKEHLIFGIFLIVFQFEQTHDQDYIFEFIMFGTTIHH